jgi:antitoxin component of RelBE/YafQ-DinJ toxin-antitoxin module
LRIPNAETTQAIEDGLAGRNLKAFKNAEDALKYLELPDA